MNLAFLRRRNRDRHATPQPHPVTVPVNVTMALREAKPDGIAYTPDLQLAERIRAELPNRPASDNLKACRFAAVLDREAAFLADKTGTVEPPERWEVIAACTAGAEALRDQVVIA